MIKKFFSVTKPGIIFGNVITVAGGFCLGARGTHDFGLFLATLIGIALVIASGCVFNNYIDRDIDSIMERTRNRVLVKGLMSGTTALIYATILGVLGTLLLYWQTNRLTVMVALIGLFVYVVVYSMWFKRHSIYGTLIGSISGAVPPVVGYCAATNRFDLGAIILFVILSLWQMPHSFAIAIFRLKDYTAASISILPVKKGIAATKIQMIAYTVAFAVAVCFMTMFGYTGFAYLIIVGGSGALWVRLAFKGLSAQDDRKWARKMFLYSIIIIIIFSIMLALDVVR